MDPTLYNAAMRGNIGDGYFLLADHLKRDEENGYQVTPKGNTVLHVAALYGHSHFVGEALKITPALLCCQNKKNENALHIAANEGHTEVVRKLLACTEDHNTKEKLTRMTDATGDTALHKAVRSQNLDVVKLLVKEDPEFEFPANHAQETPLYLEAESGFHDALISILKSCKKPTYAAGPSNRTPLHAAVIQEHKEKLVDDLCSIGRFGQRGFELKRKYKYMPNSNDETGTGGKMQQREDDHDNKADQSEVKPITKAAQMHIVVATLIMTVTFAAGITLPGGFESEPDSPDQGMAILIRKTAFRAFVVSDAIAFTCSAVTIFIYFLMADESRSPHPQSSANVGQLYDAAGTSSNMKMAKRYN